MLWWPVPERSLVWFCPQNKKLFCLQGGVFSKRIPVFFKNNNWRPSHCRWQENMQKKGFLMLFRTSRRRLSAINQKIQSNAVSFVRSNKGVPKENTTIDLVREWIRTWIQGNCDQMPDNGNVHAPVGFTIRNLFKELKSHLPWGSFVSLNRTFMLSCQKNIRNSNFLKCSVLQNVAPAMSWQKRGTLSLVNQGKL